MQKFFKFNLKKEFFLLLVKIAFYLKKKWGKKDGGTKRAW